MKSTGAPYSICTRKKSVIVTLLSIRIGILLTSNWRNKIKIRQGFVSNSSSSSFIVGIAEIISPTKFDSYIKDHKIVLNEYESYIASGNDTRYNLHKSADKITVRSFETSASTKVKAATSIFFVVNISNNEGDVGRFSYDPMLCGIDYDIDVDYFEADQRKVYDMFFDKDSGLDMDNDIRFGAARNG